MITVGLFALAIQVVNAAAPQQEIAVQNLRPSRMIQMLQSFLPSAGVLFPDDEASVVRVRGSSETFELVSQYFRLFDVAPKKLQLEAKLESPIDHSSGQVTATITNGTPFEWADFSTEIVLSTTSRINSDGTVTIAFGSTYQKKKGAIVVRAKMDETVWFQFSREGTVKVLSDPDQRTQWPLVSLKLSSKEGKRFVPLP